MADIYVDTSATYNGDGTTAAQATSDGGTGAYNNLADPLANATAGDTIWVRRLGTSISISSTLSPTNDGAYNNPIKLVGWPFKRELTGKTVDSAPTGTDSLGFNNAQWQFIDSDLTEGDNYWLGAEVEFTSGSNSGLKRKVIWFDATNDQVYLDFPLPNNIASGDQYTITLETEGYDDRPQSGIDEGWDSDSNPRPILDGGGGNFNLFYFSADHYFYLINLELKSVGTSYYLINYCPLVLENLILHNCGYCIYGNIVEYQTTLKKVFLWDFNSYAISTNGRCFAEDVHINKGPTLTGNTALSGPEFYELKNVTLGRVSALNVGIAATYTTGMYIRGENVFINATTPVKIENCNTPATGEPLISLSSFQGTIKIKQFSFVGEVYILDEDATIDPPSGAATYLKIRPNSYCSSKIPLVYKEQRYQSSGSKTYTWKFYPVNMSLDATDLEVEAWYLDESSGTHRAYATANPSAYSDDGWHDLSITVNPAQAGTVYFKIKLKKYNTSGCYVALDPEVSIS